MTNNIRKFSYSISRAARRAYWFVINLLYRWKFLTVESIPIIINNFNRVTFLQQLILSLEQVGIRNIVIIDNHSDYPPLVQYYSSLDYPIIRLSQNLGHLALWRSGLYKKFKWNYFVYSDADVVPDELCPADFLQHFIEILRRNPRLEKVGFGIRIDDLPAHFQLREEVCNYEKRYWNQPVEDGLFDAPIDTTFALYKPFCDLRNGHAFTLRAYRTGTPYVLRHLPWYVDTANPGIEELHYIATSESSSTLSQQYKGKSRVY
ncbi:MAG: glycosyltransferase family 2 protein [Cyclobacteriaceae bacterium]